MIFKECILLCVCTILLSELLCFWTFSIVGYSIEYRTMEKVQKPSNSDCDMPLSKAFGIDYIVVSDRKNKTHI
jgi:hypothetical protein